MASKTKEAGWDSGFLIAAEDKTMTKKQRKIIRAVLELSVFCLLLSACAAKTVLDDFDRFAGSDTGAYGQAGMTAAQQAAALLPKKQIRVGFVQVGHESYWRIAATKSGKQAFSKENGYDLHFVDADNDPKVQVEAVRRFIKERMDYIVIDLILTTGWTAVLKEAYHAKIPVILLDRTIDCKDKYYAAWFGSDFVREGEWAGEWLQNYLKKQGRDQETYAAMVCESFLTASLPAQKQNQDKQGIDILIVISQ